MFMPTSSPAGEYLNSLPHHRYNKLFQHSSFSYVIHSSTWQLCLSRRLALILHILILYSIITSYLYDIVSGFICYHTISFEKTMFSLPPKLDHQILHTLVAFTETCDICCNYHLLGVGLVGLSLFFSAQHKTQTV